MRTTLLALLAASTTVHAFDLLPDSLRLEAEHISHAMQHEPLTNHPTDYRFDSVSLVLRWHFGPVALDLAEGASLDEATTNPQGQLSHGALLGPREVFHARLSVPLWERR
jgi:hypothetical protein